MTLYLYHRAVCACDVPSRVELRGSPHHLRPLSESPCRSSGMGTSRCGENSPAQKNADAYGASWPRRVPYREVPGHVWTTPQVPVEQVATGLPMDVQPSSSSAVYRVFLQGTSADSKAFPDDSRP